MARISNSRTIRVDDATLKDIKQLGDRFGLSLPLVVSNAVRLMKHKSERDEAFTLFPKSDAVISKKKQSGSGFLGGMEEPGPDPFANQILRKKA